MANVKQRVLITGKGGQLAWELERTAPQNCEIFSFNASEVDITNLTQLKTAVDEVKPTIIINAAAYTAVDKAESDKALAYAVNETGSENLANVCKQASIKLVHVSTDFVFDGSKNTPYMPDDEPKPINVYGDSKLQGDLKIQAILGGDAVIVRTAWVYSANGNNFVKTMLRLMQEKQELGVIYDQVGTPTWAKGLAETLWAMALNNATGVHHWTDAGVASWYDFAIAIQEIGLELGLLNNTIPVNPIPASQYPTPAARPSFSVIDKTSAENTSGKLTRHWRKQLKEMMNEL